MESKEIKNFEYTFESSKSKAEIFKLLLAVDKWWSGLFNETIAGESTGIHDEFTFNAGGGAHYSRQKLVELIPDTRIVWQVTESNLSFLKETSEWTGTKISFDISSEGGGTTKVIFTHAGLVPHFECYTSCSDAWTQYLKNLKEKLH